MSTLPIQSHRAIWTETSKSFESPNLISFDLVTFHEKFNRTPFLVQHRLSSHPLFTLPKLVELSRRLPASSVKYNDGGLKVTADLENAPPTELSVQETINRIEDRCSWMVLKNVHEDPGYREVLMGCLKDIEEYSEELEPGMCEPRAFIFISSPNSVTPFHIDPEINFLLQIRGSKRMSIFDPLDREILPETKLEQFFLAEHLGIVQYHDHFQPRAFIAEITPGIGVHCPVTAPHWVQNGPDVSISFSITFRSAPSRRRRDIYWINAHMRRLGFSPSAFGESMWRDQLKYKLFRALAAAKKVMR